LFPCRRWLKSISGYTLSKTLREEILADLAVLVKICQIKFPPNLNTFSIRQNFSKKYFRLHFKQNLKGRNFGRFGGFGENLPN